MAYSEELALRIRVLTDGMGLEEKKMFGGLCLLKGGNMAFGVVKDELMVRVGPDDYEAALAEKHARPMDFTGRPLKGMVYVGVKGIKTEAGLRAWIERGVTFAGSLPAKKKTSAKKKASAKKTSAKKKASAKKTSAKRKTSAKKKT